MKVRHKKPSRRSNPTKSPTGNNYTIHKEDLQEDFHNHCGYCGSFNGFRHTYFEVDHFVPKSLFTQNNNISYCQYDNLVYSCKFCNNNKSSKWPSKDERIHNINNEGFVDPCDPEFDDHLYRRDDGGIRWKTELGEWMVKHAFKFDERDYSIKLLWELSRIREILDSYIEELDTLEEETKDYNLIYQKSCELSLQYVKFHKELMNYYNNL